MRGVWPVAWLTSPDLLCVQTFSTNDAILVGTGLFIAGAILQVRH